MTKKEINELKEYYNNKTLGEIRGIYLEKLRISNLHKQNIKEKAQELANLDFEHKYYIDYARNLMNDISFYKSDIKEDEFQLKLIKPILDKKELEGINQAEYEKYLGENKVNIKVLIQAVEADKQDWISEGGKVEIITKEGIKTIYFTEKEINDMYDLMLKELVWMIKDKAGNIEEVYNLRTNGNRGFDCSIKGDKANVSINTIWAGGYNIQKLHHRTLVYVN